MRKSDKTSSEASSTVSISGSFGTRNDESGDRIGGGVPSAQNSGLRRFCSFVKEFLLFLRAALNDDDVVESEVEPALLALPGLPELSSTGR